MACLRNWGFLEQPVDSSKSHMGLQLMPSMPEDSVYGCGVPVPEHYLNQHRMSVMASTNGGPFHHHSAGGIAGMHIPIGYWMNQNPQNYLNVPPENHHNGMFHPCFGVPLETTSPPSFQVSQPIINVSQAESVVPHVVEDVGERNASTSVGVNKRRGEGPKSSTLGKRPRTEALLSLRDDSTPISHRSRTIKKRAEIVINGTSIDLSSIPAPMCSCTGTPRQCYRWGSGGWQSACCTMGLSMHPLPMSTKRRGARIAGRKMSVGAFKKVLEKLSVEGHDLSNPIDLRNYWARHGTNKFVTIR